MADIASWYITELPSEIVDIVERDVKKLTYVSVTERIF